MTYDFSDDSLSFLVKKINVTNTISLFPVVGENMFVLEYHAVHALSFVGETNLMTVKKKKTCLNTHLTCFYLFQRQQLITNHGFKHVI